MDWIAALNQEQRRAVEAGDGPVLIVAGPGTGKTKTLTARMAWLIASGKAKSSEILALTFTKKAAEEMAHRVVALLGTGVRAPRVATFHALCHELLGNDLQFVSDAARLQLIKSLSKPASLKGVSVRELGLLISKAKNDLEAPEADLAKLVRAYNKALQTQGVCDFDDLLVQAHELLTSDEAVRERLRSQYRYVLVDEFQDTNALQYALLRALLGTGNLFVIGDPNQSIYGFRGASSTIFDQFRRDYPQHQAIALTANYRSSPEIVRLSNAIFADDTDLQAVMVNSGRVRAVQVLNEYGEAAWVLAEIQQAIGGGDFLRAVSDDQRHDHRTLRDFAVIYRSRAAALTLQKLFEESGLPYQIVGEGSPYDKPEVQAVLALLRAALSGEIPELEGVSAAERHAILELLQPAASFVPSALAERVIKILGFEPTPALAQFVNGLVRFKTVGQSLEHIDAMAEQGFYDPKADAITLLTIHAAKGLEFLQVFVIGAEQGILPHHRADHQEERRLFYVAVTRAKERLEILHAKHRGGQPAEPSVFVTGLPAHTIERMADPDMPAQARRIAKRAAKRSQQSLF